MYNSNLLLNNSYGINNKNRFLLTKRTFNLTISKDLVINFFAHQALNEKFIIMIFDKI